MTEINNESVPRRKQFMAKESFGTRLARLRKEHDYTQNDIADKVGVTSQAVSRWENDQASPDIDIIVKLADLYDITTDELLGKEKPAATSFQEKPTKKSLDKMFFKIKVHDAEDGDDVNVNLPLALVRIFVNKESGKINILNGNKNLENIDFRQLIEMVEQGVVGELISVDSKDGTTVRISVE